jgi:hypothetical protein
LEIVRLHALKWSDQAIANALGLSYSAVRDYRVHHLRLPAWPRMELERTIARSDCSVVPHRERVIELYQLGHSDAEIAAEIGVKREAVGYYRRKWLTLQATPRKELLHRAKGRRSQERSMGYGPQDVRAEQLWSYATDLGWPAGLRKRAAQILETLLAHGPQTRASLIALVGPIAKSNDPQGTYLGNLIARGLVAAAQKVIPHTDDARRRVNLYCATPLAVAMKAEWRSAQSLAPLSENSR